MCSPYGELFCCWREREDRSILLERWLRREKENQSILLERWLRRGSFARFHRLLYCLGKSSGQNGISHPYWVKICDVTTAVKLIYAPNRNSKFFLLQAKVLDCNIEVSEFELQSRQYVHFQTNTLGKGRNSLSQQ